MDEISIIPPSAHFALWAIITGLAALAFRLETTRLGRNVSGIVFAILGSMLLANFSVIPKSAPAYDLVWSYLVPIAIPLLLFKANFRQIIPETGGMLIAFLIGSLGTVAGTLLGFWLLPLGQVGAELAGVFSATYIGGSMNFAAVAEALNIDSALLAASVAADNVIGVLLLAVLALLPSVAAIRRWIPSAIIDEAEDTDSDAELHSETSAMNLYHLSLSLALSLSICAGGYTIAKLTGFDGYGILFVTALAVIIANVFHKPMAKLEGHFELGMLFMYIFFAALGAGADIARMIDSALVIVLFALIIVVTHLLVILVGGKLFKLDLAEIIIASNACAAGPSTAAALAAGKRWRRLITPGVMCGVFGYAIANFVGIALASWLA